MQRPKDEYEPLPLIQIRVPSYSKEIHENGAVTLRDSVGLRLELSADIDEKTKNAAEFYAANLPQRLREKLAAADVPIHVVNKMSDLNPSLKDLPLPVLDPRKSWDEVGAAYFDDQEWNMLGKKGVVVTPAFLEFALVHETAHALDDIDGRPSHTAEFKELWNADLQNAMNKKLSINPYLAQMGNRGPEEAFAELFDALNSKVPNKKQEETLQTFPRLAKYIYERYFAK